MSKSNDTQLQEIMVGIGNGTTQLPDFQRGWIWDDERIRNLIASISNNYPIGAVLFLEYGGDGIRFKSRLFTNVKETGITPELLVLDGQQRLTSVYCAMCNSNPVPTTFSNKKEIIRRRYYYLDIVKCLNPEVDRADAVVSVSALRTNIRGHSTILDLSTREKEFEEHMFPLNIVFNSEESDDWKFEYRLYHKRDAEIGNRLNAFTANILNVITGYTLPVIQLEKKLPKEAVCQVFENVNTGGVLLTIFDLVTATFAAENYFLREDWEKRKTTMIDAPETYGILDAVSPTDFLVSMTLLSEFRENATLGATRKNVLSLSLESYKNNVDDLTEGYIKSAQFLVEQGIFDKGDLPYTTQLTPLSILMVLLGEDSDDEFVRAKLSIWYWCGVFGEMYGGSIETNFINDIAVGLPWVKCNEDLESLYQNTEAPVSVPAPRTVSQAYFQPKRIYSLRSRKSAAYKGVMALLIKGGARDFISGEKIDGSKIKADNVDMHLIFPPSFCVKKNIDKRFWNCIANRTPMKASTNRAIKNYSPSEYLSNIETKNHVPYDNVRMNFESHEIDVCALENDDFKLFLKNRSNAILELIERAMNKAIGSMIDLYDTEVEDLQDVYEYEDEDN